MELFYSTDIQGGICRLDHDESGHCIKVLRHKSGDEINVIDGYGTMYTCRITSDSHKAVEAVVIQSVENWGSHPYNLHLAVCPTKNNDRYEWFAEKACEIGFDTLSPIIGDHSERRILKIQRVEKILVSAAKQSLKAAVPSVNEPVSVKEFIKSTADSPALKLIAYCFEDENTPRRSIKDVLSPPKSKSATAPVPTWCPLTQAPALHGTGLILLHDAEAGGASPWPVPLPCLRPPAAQPVGLLQWEVPGKASP